MYDQLAGLDSAGIALSAPRLTPFAAQVAGLAAETMRRLEQYVGGVLFRDGLAEVLSAPDLATALARRDGLPANACCVTAAGDIVSRQSMTLFAPDSAAHGLLERQREIDALAALIAEREARVARAQANLGTIEQELADAQHGLHQSRQQLAGLQDRAHAMQVETLKLAQAQERFRERQAQIDANLAEMAAEEESERERLFLADEAIDAQRAQLDELRAVMDTAQALFEQTEQALRDERAQVNGAERDLREAEFSQREGRNKLQAVSYTHLTLPTSDLV